MSPNLTITPVTSATTTSTTEKKTKKRSFDVAFLTGEVVKSEDSNPALNNEDDDEHKKMKQEVLPSLSPSGFGSAFTKVTKSPTKSTAELSPRELSYPLTHPNLYHSFLKSSLYSSYFPPHLMTAFIPEKKPTAKLPILPTTLLNEQYPPPQTPPTLLPSSYAPMTVPNQNMCASCNLSFRMTSDLVYHMRTHHRTENNTRHRRDEKLRCPICSETFRERHHLTRHTVAHNEKDGE